MINLSESPFKAWLKRKLPPSRTFIEQRLDEIEMSVTRTVTRVPLSCEFQRKVLSVVRFLAPERIEIHRKVRVGSAGDGGYVQVDDYKGISRALSFGVSDDDSWDLAMAELGVPVEQFDHSVESAPSTHPLLHFHRKMISTRRSADTATLSELVAQHSKRDIPDLILKIDIEGSEWDVFDAAAPQTLSTFSQILCEFHSLSCLQEPEFRIRAHRVLEKLADHFAPIHVHANNAGKICNVANVPLPDLLEVTFANRSRYSFAASDETFPTPLDAPNLPGVADIALGSFRFSS